MIKRKLTIPIYFLIFSIGLFTSCNSSKLVITKSGKQIDKRLVGSWGGSEESQETAGVSKNWVMQRNADGSYKIQFVFNNEEGIRYSNEVGNWWIEDGKFHEYHKISQKTDVYDYVVLNKNEIKFQSVQLSYEANVETYEFIDKRIKDKSQLIKDGSSTEKAIKVNSISDEYRYVGDICKGCQLIEQALIKEKKKAYDVITVKKPDGSTVSYYFDISSFFGKF
ncbi:MAG: hypothetical protein GQ527_05325 [Bacteroidales bacterium]|nr:hypothetical protein [Bacteroidales bacterium]